ncbi:MULTISPECIES: hypothetical protein [Paraburkholderia]|uniref:Lipoprotein n=1 Tax=Paraburkholderia pallida TaxID=2547399 RepID=A0A4P7D1M6_9BURK|nr:MULTISPECIES: hypothetical protein [Paraburkholderia]QBR01097.1 hypothetical protein E1956_28080 [Paraburkholderia pallida]
MKLTKSRVCAFTVAAVAAVAGACYAIGGPDQESYVAGFMPCSAVDSSGQPQDCVPVDRTRMSIAALHGM